MFLIGQSISAADIVVHAKIAENIRNLGDYQKIQVPHAFRWIDHIQHLPGMIEQVEALGLFVSFPNENAEAPSKAELARLAKEQWKKDKKAGLLKEQTGEEKKAQN